MRVDLRLAAALVAASCLAVAAPLLPSGSTAPLWSGHRILLVESAAPEEEVLRRLGEAGIRGVVSESLQPVQISDFRNLETVTLAEAGRRLFEGDPRRDAWIEGLPAWFQATVDGKPFRIFYLPTSFAAGPAKVTAALEGLGADFLLPEGEVSSESTRLPGLVFALALLALLALALRRFLGDRTRLRQLGFVAAFAFPLLPLALGGGGGACLSILLLGCAWSVREEAELAMDELALSRGLLRSLRILGRAIPRCLPFLLSAIGLAAIDPSLLLPAVMALLASVLSAFCLSYFLAGRSSSRRRFVPVPISGLGPSPADRRARGPDTLVPAVFVLAAFFALALGEGLPRPTPASAGSARAVVLPLPEGQPGPPRPTPRRASELISVRPEAALVDLSDWLVHRWRQEALFYESLGEKAPLPFAPSIVPAPSSKESLVRNYDEAWALGAWKSLPKGGIEGMLASQGNFTQVFPGLIDRRKPQPLAPLRALLYIILGAPPLIRVFLPRRSGIRRVREPMKPR